jgi:hypothetical protein
LKKAVFEAEKVGNEADIAKNQIVKKCDFYFLNISRKIMFCTDHINWKIGGDIF